MDTSEVAARARGSVLSRETVWRGGLASVAPRSNGGVLLLGYWLEPVDCLAVERLLDRYVGHRGRGPRAVPMPLVRRDRDDVARPDLLDRPALSLEAADSGKNDECLAQRVGVPVGPSTRLERDHRGGGAPGRR